ncbi:Ldh family oxidoreductase [Sporosarcina globispora]|uniref:Ldh family oxidoreductase n=1 Tax=Sporosarcina globispora TaxID=1459 RepID=UPI0006A9A6D7|nr:Ldh family oxidoreductase [Sporosarcina globispora]
MVTEKILIKSRNLNDFCTQILHKAGLPQEEAVYVSTLLTEAELRGRSTHGVVRLKTYVDFVNSGSINVKPNIKTLKDEMAITVIDGDNGFGQIVATKAMDLAIEKARKFGVGIVGVQNSGHLGEIGLIAKRVIPHRMIGSVLTNGGPMMAAWGGSKAILGNNPFAVCVPRENGPPLIVDMALSKTARGNIILADREGRAIPEGWALNKEGYPTTDPKEALLGSVLPMAEHKGYALSLIIEVISSVLIGGLPGYSLGMLSPPLLDRPLGTSNLVTAININNFIDWDHFQIALENLISTIKESARDEENIFIPGERSEKIREKRLRLGVELTSNIVADLKYLGEEFNVNFPLE